MLTIDQPEGTVALFFLLVLLRKREQSIAYVAGRTVERACDGYRSVPRTDTCTISIWRAEAPDPGGLRPNEDNLLAELQPLLARRRDLVADRTWWATLRPHAK